MKTPSLQNINKVLSRPLKRSLKCTRSIMCLEVVIGPYQVLVHVHVLRLDQTQLGPRLPHDAHRPAGGMDNVSSQTPKYTSHHVSSLPESTPTDPSETKLWNYVNDENNQKYCYILNLKHGVFLRSLRHEKQQRALWRSVQPLLKPILLIRSTQMVNIKRIYIAHF